MQQKKIIIFCTTIRDGFRIFSYLWDQLDSPIAIREERIRMYNALNWPDYNLRTQELMRKPGSCQVIVATDILMVGVDFPDINDVVIIGHPPNVNNYLQKIGRAGRDHILVPNPRGIMYITSRMKKAAYNMLEIKPPTVRLKKGQLEVESSKKLKGRSMKKHKKSTAETLTSKSSMSVEIAQLVVSKCKTDELDTMYGNPVLHPSMQCNCSGCVPEQEVLRGSPRRRLKGKAHSKLTKGMKERTTKQLTGLREQIYRAANSKMLTDPFLALPRLLPNELISRIIAALFQLTRETLGNLISKNKTVKPHTPEIWKVVIELRESFEWELKQKADKKKQGKSKKRCAYLPVLLSGLQPVLIIFEAVICW